MLTQHAMTPLAFSGTLPQCTRNLCERLVEMVARVAKGVRNGPFRSQFQAHHERVADETFWASLPREQRAFPS
eukprot:1598592-Lingulodinium_polyedra.AAC.1